MSNDSSVHEARDEHPTCDHRDCHPDPNPAVAKHEFISPPAGSFQAWAYAEHDPGGPALKRIDPGPENRTIAADTDKQRKR
jgi:hypothetical protein